MPTRYVGEAGRRAWNIAQAVCYGGYAKRTDTKLVQFLLNATSRQMLRDGRITTGWVLDVDGIYGPKSHDAVVVVQKHVDQSTVDGRVSVMKGGSLGYGTGVYTLLKLLNNYTTDLFMTEKDEKITVPMFNEAMDWLPFDSDLDPEVSSEMLNHFS